MAAAQDQKQWNTTKETKFNLYRSYLYKENPPIAFYGTDLEGVKSYTTDEPIFHRWGNIELKLVDLDNSLYAMYKLYEKLDNETVKKEFLKSFYLKRVGDKVTGYRVSDNKKLDINFFNILKEKLPTEFDGSYTQKGKTDEHGLGLNHGEIVIWDENIMKYLNPSSNPKPKEKETGKIVYDEKNCNYTVDNNPVGDDPYYQPLQITLESNDFYNIFINKRCKRQREERSKKKQWHDYGFPIPTLNLEPPLSLKRRTDNNNNNNYYKRNSKISRSNFNLESSPSLSQKKTKQRLFTNSGGSKSSKKTKKSKKVKKVKKSRKAKQTRKATKSNKVISRKRIGLTSKKSKKNKKVIKQ